MRQEKTFEIYASELSNGNRQKARSVEKGNDSLFRKASNSCPCNPEDNSNGWLVKNARDQPILDSTHIPVPPVLDALLAYGLSVSLFSPSKP